ncbi:MAG: RNA polymerase sigma factor [Bacteroidota bacterium]
MNTDKLLQACLQGEERAQRRFYDLHKVKMYGLCLRFAASQTEAEDMLMEGFYKVFRDLHQFKGQCPLEAWVRQVMVNSALMHLRKRNRQLIASTSLDDLTDDPVTDDNPLERLNTDAVIALIQQLPAGFRTVFNLYAIEGYSHKEIGRQLGISESTSRSQYARAKKTLQRLIVEHGIVDAR